MADFYELHKQHEGTKKRAVITYMWGDYPAYKARFKGDCRDESDLSAFIEWIRGGYEDVQMGKILVRTEGSLQDEEQRRLNRKPGLDDDGCEIVSERQAKIDAYHAKAAHTPGPWNRGYGNHIYRGELARVDQPLIAICEPTNGTKEELETVFANAKLISAAPDLLEALQAFMALEPDYAGSAYISVNAEKACAVARETAAAAIAKATK